MRILLRLLTYLWHYRGRAAAAYLCLALSVVFGAAIPYFIKEAIDRGLSARDQQFLIFAAAAIVFVTAFKGAFSFLQGYLTEYLAQRVAFDLRNALYDRFQRLSFSFHDQSQTGQLMSRATADVEGVRMFISLGALVVVSAMLTVLVVFALMFSLNWRLSLVALLFMPILAYRAVRVGRTLRPMFLAVQQEFAAMSTVLQENLAGVRVVKAFAREDYEIAKFSRRVSALFRRNLETARQQSFNLPLMNMILGLAMGVTFWYGSREVIADRLTLGGLVAFNGYLAMLGLPVRRLGWMVMLIARAVSSGERIYEILDATAEIADSPTATEMPPLEGRVCFENVSFKYAAASPSLRNVNLTVEPGEVIAVLGNTGSGKSTLINLIPRFYDVSGGRLTIDGLDVRNVKVSSLRRQIGFVLQETFLFSASIRDNISFGRSEASLEDIVAAAKAAHAHEFITSFPDGYETWVGERGITLSGGQKQRIAIARTLLLDPRILILDDSTSSVDAETENLIRQALSHLIEGRTTFVIAHRLGTIMSANRIVILDNGEIVEQGTHQELLAIEGHYRRIYDLQMHGQGDPALAPGRSNGPAVAVNGCHPDSLSVTTDEQKSLPAWPQKAGASG